MSDKKEELIADAIYTLAKEVTFLGNGAACRNEQTGFGAIEGLAMRIYDSNKDIAASISDVADAIRELAQAISDKEK